MDDRTTVFGLRRGTCQDADAAWSLERATMRGYRDELRDDGGDRRTRPSKETRCHCWS